MVKKIKYILGKNYKDCKNLLNNIKLTDDNNQDTMFTFVTKPKHIKATGDFNDYYLTDGFLSNIHADEILTIIDYDNLIKKNIGNDDYIPVITSEENIENELNNTYGVDAKKEFDYMLSKEMTEINTDEEKSETNEIIDDSIEEEIKPIDPPRGWHSRNEYIDEDGNVYHKGDYQYNIKDEYYGEE